MNRLAGWGREVWFSSALKVVSALLLAWGVAIGAGGCKTPGAAVRSFPGQIRPASDTGRLLQNAAYLRQTGRLDLAVKELAEAYARQPENLEILDALTQCYEELGRFDQAQELYDEALRRLGSHPALENNRCYGLALAGRLAQAEACFREVLKRNPHNQAARNNLGLLLVRRGQEAEALALWRESEDEAAARRRLGQCLAALGRESAPAYAAAPAPREPQPDKVESRPTARPPAPAASRGESQAAAAPSAAPPARPVSAPPPSAPTPQATAPRAPAPAPPPVAAPTAAPAFAATPRVAAATSSAAPAASTLPPAKAEKPASSSPAPSASGSTARIQEPPPADWGHLRVEIRNGNGVKDSARVARELLKLAGFQVVGIGNHVDFGLERTVISYRPGAEAAARYLAARHFPGAMVQPSEKLPAAVQLRVSLGHDRCNPPATGGRAAPAAPSAAAPPPGTPRSRAAAPPQAPTPAAPATPAAKAVGSAAMAPMPVRVELKNGNGAKDLARQMRRRLKDEGFTVVAIGNHVDFGLEKTIIAYQPGAGEAAALLARKFFPGAELREQAALPPQVEIRVSLGRDVLEPSDRMARALP
jgi:Flp pilus assembly protein TadD